MAASASCMAAPLSGTRQTAAPAYSRGLCRWSTAARRRALECGRIRKQPVWSARRSPQRPGCPAATVAYCAAPAHCSVADGSEIEAGDTLSCRMSQEASGWCVLQQSITSYATSADAPPDLCLHCSIATCCRRAPECQDWLGFAWLQSTVSGCFAAIAAYF